MNQSLNAFLYLNEQAEVSYIGDFPNYCSTYGITVGNLQPRVFGELLDT